MQHTVYLAGPITGLTYKQATAWRDRVTSELAPGILTISPLRGIGPPDVVFDACPVGTVGRDLYDIRRCDLVLANLSKAAKVSKGTLVEIGYALALHKPVIVAINGFHDHPFVVEPALYVVDELEKAIMLAKVVLMP
jgi:nucleoside 2-deoxyribosyltransferase